MEDIHRKFVRLGRQRNKITYELLALIPEIFKNKIYEQHGYCSIYEYAAKLAGLSFPVVKKALRLGEHLEDKPHLQAAIQTQGIHKVAIIARLATPDTDGAWADNVCNMSKAGLQELSKEIRGRSGEPKKLVIELDAEMEFMFLKIKKKMGDSASNKEIFRQLLRNATRQNAPKKTYVKKSPGISKVDVPRYVPVAKKREALSATRGRCAFPGCN